MSENVSEDQEIAKAAPDSKKPFIEVGICSSNAADSFLKINHVLIPISTLAMEQVVSETDIGRITFTIPLDKINQFTVGCYTVDQSSDKPTSE